MEANKRNKPRIEEDESANEKSSEKVVLTSRRQNSKKSETRNKKKSSSTSSMSSFRILPSIKDKEEHLQDKFADDTVFKGMTNYESLVRYLEEKRIANDEKNIISENDRTDHFNFSGRQYCQ